MSFSAKVNGASQKNVTTCTYFFNELKKLNTDVVDLFNKIKPLLIDLSLKSSLSPDQIEQRQQALEKRQKSTLGLENNALLNRANDLDKRLSDSRDLTMPQQTVLGKITIKKAIESIRKMISFYQKGEVWTPPGLDDSTRLFREIEASLTSTQVTNKIFAKAICDGFTVLRQQIDDIARKPFRQTPVDKYQSIFEDITKLEAKSATLNEATQAGKDLTMTQKDLFRQQHEEICDIAIRTIREMRKQIEISRVSVTLCEEKFITLKLDFSEDSTIDSQIRALLNQKESYTSDGHLNRLIADLEDIKNSREEKPAKAEDLRSLLMLPESSRPKTSELKGGVKHSYTPPSAGENSEMPSESSPLNPPIREPRNAERNCFCSVV